MTYDEALHFWFRRVNYELKAPPPAALKLDRIHHLLRLLGDPQNRFGIVHVAGSKGKGSTAAMLDSILASAGYRVGLFTSPHLVHVEERIQVNGKPVTPVELAGLMEEIATASASATWQGAPLAEALTFFEIATALGFLHFARQQVDLAVVEVGLGGRFDATNVCQPAVAVITSISYDHVQVLGNTLARIAREKGGIIKPGRPVVSGVLGMEARTVIESICAERQAPLLGLDRDFHFQYTPGRIALGKVHWPHMSFQGKETFSGLRLGLMGEHQAANAALAIAAAEVLRQQGWPISEQAFAAGLANVQWPARLEIVRWNPLVILDCAHNVASARALLQTLHESLSLPNDARRWLLFAGSKDKDLAGMLHLLGPAFDRLILTRFTTNPRAEPPQELANCLSADLQAKTDVVEDPQEALRATLAQARPQDLLCITGSVFLAGELRPRLRLSVRVAPRER